MLVSNQINMRRITQAKPCFCIPILLFFMYSILQDIYLFLACLDKNANLGKKSDTLQRDHSAMNQACNVCVPKLSEDKLSKGLC